MMPIETILKSLEGNTLEFKRLCESSVCSSKLQADLDKGIELGRILLADIERAVLHLTTVEEVLFLYGKGVTGFSVPGPAAVGMKK